MASVTRPSDPRAAGGSRRLGCRLDQARDPRPATPAVRARSIGRRPGRPGTRPGSRANRPATTSAAGCTARSSTQHQPRRRRKPAPARRRNPPARSRGDSGARRSRVGRAGRGREMVRRDPRHAARNRRRAAHLLGALEQDDLRTGLGRGQRGCQPRGTRTDDDHVVLAATHPLHARAPVVEGQCRHSRITFGVPPSPATGQVYEQLILTRGGASALPFCVRAPGARWQRMSRWVRAIGPLGSRVDR